MVPSNTLSLVILALFYTLFARKVCVCTFDINDRQLQMVADSLTLKECRKLSESLHDKAFALHGLPKGDTEPKQVSCLRLLQHWNTHEGKGQTFHQLALRLKQLGHRDIADRLSLSVSDEKVGEVQDLFLKDPFKSKIHTNSPLLQESPHVETLPPSKKPSNALTCFEVAEVVIFVCASLVFVCLFLLFFIRFFVPDSFVRMRVSLYKSFVGKRPGDEEMYFIM
ncbi:hypothetical protein AVEN_138847-1 [Araneus ventricosus]|uniref:Death domain-containing protein n=1 Tax=Araneus ventricosus TaxID=182803 RepID=A0A4Y2GBT6_ARAVE|nr:hypothetical protein AVEN_138847-1 [Araneus ventricosus]